MTEYNRLWQPIEFNEAWQQCDTSILDDISASWFERRKKLKEDSGEYADFLSQLKREHAIETGVIERLYDLKRGVTETLIKQGFIESFLSHGDTNIAKSDLLHYLNDHLEAVNFVFDIVKEDRPLTVSFIRELHQLVTRNQKYTEGRDQFGNNLQVTLLKGKYKERENNPTREDGTEILYCPPEQVASEMDNLILIYNAQLHEQLHPLILATWFHHAFTTIHPFQDGNGRMARLLTSLIFIKFGYFPFTVLREEAKAKYIEALEQADKGEFQPLVTYFGEVQKRNIQKALNLKDVSSTSLAEVQAVLGQKVEAWQHQNSHEQRQLLVTHRNEIFDYCNTVLNEFRHRLKETVNGNIQLDISSCSFDNSNLQHYFYTQMMNYAQKHDYFFNRTLPKAWLIFELTLAENKKYQLIITLHYYGYDDSTLAIGSLLQFKESEQIDTALPLEIPPHIISISNDVEAKKRNIRSYLENALTLALAQIASEI